MVTLVRPRVSIAFSTAVVFPIPEGALVFPSTSGGFIQGTNFRSRVFSKLVTQALGKGRHYTPHCLRHTWASLHLAWGKPIKWVQTQGGWTTAKVLLDTYGHFMPDEMRGFADALSTASNGPETALTGKADDQVFDADSKTSEFSWVSESLEKQTGPRSPIMHFAHPRKRPHSKKFRAIS